MPNSSIWPIDRALSGVTTLSQSGPRNNGKESVLRIHQKSSICETSESDYLVSIRILVGEFYPSAEMQSVYSAASADWAMS